MGKTTSSNIQPRGKHYVATEPGESIATRAIVGSIELQNGQRLQVKRAFVTATSGASTALVPAVANAAIRVLSMVLLGGGTAPTVTFKSGTDAISPAFACAANGGFVLPPNTWGWFQTNVINEALNVTVSSSSDVGVIINYIEITQDNFDLL